MDNNAGCYILGSVVDPTNMQEIIEKSVAKKTKSFRMFTVLMLSVGAYCIYKLDKRCKKLENGLVESEKEPIETDYSEGD